MPSRGQSDFDIHGRLPLPWGTPQHLTGLQSSGLGSPAAQVLSLLCSDFKAGPVWLWSASSTHRHLPYSMSPWIASALNYLGRKGFSGGSVGQKSSWNARDAWDPGSIPGSGRSSGGGQGDPLWCSCLENPMDRGAWQATVHEVTKSWTQLKGLSMYSCIWEGNRKKKLFFNYYFLTLNLEIYVTFLFVCFFF